MALRPPKSFSPKSFSPRTGERPGFLQLEAEIMAEAASALGHQGRMAEEALARYAKATDADREVLAQAAADAVWAYFVQREFCGMRDHTLIIREMNIPPSVLNRIGVMSKP